MLEYQVMYLIKRSQLSSVASCFRSGWQAVYLGPDLSDYAVLTGEFVDDPSKVLFLSLEGVFALPNPLDQSLKLSDELVAILSPKTGVTSGCNSLQVRIAIRAQLQIDF